jgi:hypothetical protein
MKILILFLKAILYDFFNYWEKFRHSEEKRLRKKFNIPKKDVVPIEYFFGPDIENMFYKIYLEKNNIKRIA